MYAFALWDSADGSLFAARDPFGIKPFYFSLEGGRLLFASEVAALLASGAKAAEIDPASVADYLAWLARQDSGPLEAFWRARLYGFSEPTRRAPKNAAYLSDPYWWAPTSTRLPRGAPAWSNRGASAGLPAPIAGAWDLSLRS